MYFVSLDPVSPYPNNVKARREEEDIIVDGKLDAAKSCGDGEAPPNKRCNTAASGKSNSSDKISALYSYLDAVENGDSEGNSPTRSSIEDGNSSRTAMSPMTKGERR